jgi:hypothetical protein
MARYLPGHKAQEWQQRLVRFENSRRSVNAFCQQEGVSPQSFYLRRKRLARLPGARQPAAESPDAFLPVRVLPSGGVRVRLPGGTRLVIPMADSHGLQLVIEALARIDADRLGGAAAC